MEAVDILKIADNQNMNANLQQNIPADMSTLNLCQKENAAGNEISKFEGLY